MTADPITIHFQPNVSPSAHHCPIRVKHHWIEKVKADLDRDVRLGIIEPVPQTHRSYAVQEWWLLQRKMVYPAPLTYNASMKQHTGPPIIQALLLILLRPSHQTPEKQS